MADPVSAAVLAGTSCSHISLALALDFTRKRVRGSATLTIPLGASSAGAAPEVVLDVHPAVAVHAVAALPSHGSPWGGAPLALPFARRAFSKVGEALAVDLAPLRDAAGGLPATLTLRVHCTSEGGPGATFLDPPMTAGREHPFLFTQGQSVLMRTIFPLVDSPGVRVTWDATFVVEAWATVLASAQRRIVREGEEVVCGEADGRARGARVDWEGEEELLAALLPRAEAEAGAAAAAAAGLPADARAFRYAQDLCVPT
jgi:leukotriene-A4 hydrolase